MFHMTLNVPFQFLHHHGCYVFHLNIENSQYDFLCTSCLFVFYCFFFLSIDKQIDWFTSKWSVLPKWLWTCNFRYSWIIFLKKRRYIYLYNEQGGRTSHCLSYCHSQEQSCINKNVSKSVISLSPGIFTAWTFFDSSKKFHSLSHSLFKTDERYWPTLTAYV